MPQRSDARSEERFLFTRLLGTGSFGSVYLAEDRSTHSLVAVKHLRRDGPAQRFRFKHEFRLLATCVHPNLVRYYELLEIRKQWYLVMEFIDGADLLSHVQLPRTSPRSDDTLSLIIGDIDMSDAPRPGSTRNGSGADDPPHLPCPLPGDRAGRLARIRAVLPQLADGLSHLHRADIFHRDLSPRNILVDGDGRVVILDFGIALHGHSDLANRGLNQCLGTPLYMAPEQVAGQHAGAASDWYSVGILLYEMLTGTAPISGRPMRILRLKCKQAPSDPRLIDPGLPNDLCDLCMELQEIAPQNRPVDAARRLRRCGDPGSTGPGSARITAPPPPKARFVGRADLLGRLQEVYATWKATASSQAVMLHGPSGIGKTALVEHFTNGLPTGDLVLHGHCFQRESASFKVLDSLAEALCGHLQEREPEEVERLLPQDIAYLARFLPPLLLVSTIEKTVAVAQLPDLDPNTMRQRAVSALRVLLRRLMFHRRLVIVIDDMQWADQDSLATLALVLAPPAAPPLLLLCLHTDNDATVGGPSNDFDAARIPLVRMEVGPLDETESADLFRQLFPPAHAEAEHDLLALQRNAGGNPLMIGELAKTYLRTARTRCVMDLDMLFAQHVDTLSEPARRLLACAAIAGRPCSLDILGRAAGDEIDAQKATHQLCAESLLRAQVHPDGNCDLQVFNNSIATAILARLTPDMQRQLHAALARILATTEDTDPDIIFQHWLAADQRDQAIAPGLVAASRAMQNWSFDRAVTIYRRLLDILPSDGDRPDLLLQLAQALACSGRNAQAAQAYAEAATDRDFPGRLHALQCAAGHFLRSGHVDEGLRCAQAVLHEIGQRWTEHPGAAWTSLQGNRLKLWWGGMRHREAPLQVPTPVIRLNLDTLHSIAQGLGWIDALRGAELHTRHLLLAITTGDPHAISHGLAWEAILIANEGGTSSDQRARELMAWGHDLAVSLPDDRALAWCYTAQAFIALTQAHWESAIAYCSQAERLFRTACANVSWELGSLYALCWLPALLRLGRLAELRRMVEAVEQEHALVGDLYTLVTVRTVVKPWLHLADGNPLVARQEAESAIASWSQQDWNLQHLFALTARVRVALFCGDGQLARRLLSDHWPRITASMQLQLQVERVTMLYLRGQAAVMCAADHPRAAEIISAIMWDATNLGNEGTGLASAYAAVLRAALLAIQGNRSAAREAYRSAAGIHDTLVLPLHAAACRRREAELGADEAALAAADGLLRSFGIRDPARMTATLIAGPPPAPWTAPPTSSGSTADQMVTPGDIPTPVDGAPRHSRTSALAARHPDDGSENKETSS